MRADHILNRTLADATLVMHRARANAVVSAVKALMRGGQVALSAMGRELMPRSPKHGIKRIDRLLGNQSLIKELPLIYHALARRVLGTTQRPVILLDWTLAGDAMCSLTAAVPIRGRALVIHSVTVSKKQWTSRTVEDAFLAALRVLVGPDRKPILVADAGFRGPWRCSVEALGWDYVVRIRGRAQVQRVGEEAWSSCRTLWAMATRRARSLGRYRIGRNQRREENVVVVDKRSGRARQPAPCTPRRAVAKQQARSHREPWMLATTLRLPAKQVVAIYAARMQIELTFRDLKSHRFGWSFEDAGCKSPARVAIQVMLAALASFVCLIAGIAVEEARLQTRFQANTTRSRRVLSLVRLGREAIQSLDELSDLPEPNLSQHQLFVGIR